MTHAPLWTGKAARQAAVAIGVLLTAFLCIAGQAFASEPTGEYKVFKGCPYENTAVKQCVFSETTSGEEIVGNTKVNITHPFVLQGGSALNFETGKETFYAAKSGYETLTKVGEPLEGGLLNLIPRSSVPAILLPLYEKLFEEGLSGVNVVTELARPASEIGISAAALAEGEGTVLTLPVKVHLENLFLGSNCYIGSTSNPLYLHLTAGTTSPPSPNKPITGSPGAIEFKQESTILVALGYKLVDNSFAAPKASGCGGFAELLVNPIVQAKIGNSEAGHNTAILNGTLERGYAPAVRASVK